jgi:hypothetical protein
LVVRTDDAGGNSQREGTRFGIVMRYSMTMPTATRTVSLCMRGIVTMPRLDPLLTRPFPNGLVRAGFLFLAF